MSGRRKIWKFPLPHDFGEFGADAVEVPLGARLVAADRDPGGNLALWCLVDPEETGRERIRVEVVATGGEVPPPGEYRRANTVVTGPLVWHVYVGRELPDADGGD